MVDLLLRWQVTCADIAASRLDNVRRYFPDHDIRTQECDIFDLPFDDEAFDLVLCCSLVQHIERDRLPAMFAKLRQVTSKWVVASYPTNLSLAHVQRRLRGRRNTVLSGGAARCLFELAGLRMVQSRYVLPLVASGKVVLLEKV